MSDDQQSLQEQLQGMYKTLRPNPQFDKKLKADLLEAYELAPKRAFAGKTKALLVMASGVFVFIMFGYLVRNSLVEPQMPGASLEPAAAIRVTEALTVATPTIRETAPAKLDINEDLLKNMEYSGILSHTVTLNRGRYVGEPYVEGGQARPSIRMSDIYAIGDLNGDELEDVVVLLRANFGGVGSFSYLAVLLNESDQLFNVNTIPLNGEVTQLEIFNGEVAVEVSIHEVGQAMADPPSKHVLQLYSLVDEELILIDEQIRADTPIVTPSE